MTYFSTEHGVLKSSRVKVKVVQTTQPNENSHTVANLNIHIANAMSSFLLDMMWLLSSLAVHSQPNRMVPKELKLAFEMMKKMLAITMICNFPKHPNIETDIQ